MCELIFFSFHLWIVDFPILYFSFVHFANYTYELRAPIQWNANESVPMPIELRICSQLAPCSSSNAYAGSHNQCSNNNAEYPFIRVDLRKVWLSTGRVFISWHSAGHISCEVWGFHSIMNSYIENRFTADWVASIGFPFSNTNPPHVVFGLIISIGCSATKPQHFMVEPEWAFQSNFDWALPILAVNPSIDSKNKTFASQLYLRFVLVKLMPKWKPR